MASNKLSVKQWRKAANNDKSRWHGGNNVSTSENMASANDTNNKAIANNQK